MHLQRQFLFSTLLVFCMTITMIIPLKARCEIQDIINQHKNHCLVINNIESGMFAEFIMVLGALNLYDQGLIGGVRVDFNKGFYVDQEKGPNWWKYFFKSLHLGIKELPHYSCSLQEGVELAQSGHALPRNRNAELIQKYIKIKSDIQQEVDAFVSQNFEPYIVIGVHHRGTDKIIEMPIVGYDRTCQMLIQIINNLSVSQRAHVRIYVATDDQHFLNYLEGLFPSILIYNNFARSTDGTPLHYGTNLYSSNYQKGKEALIDCLLMSKCQLLLRPVGSCVSLVSTYFNPTMPTISLPPN